jgi:hypothetical protein
MSSTTGMIVAFKAGVGRNAEQQVQIAKTE